MNVAIGTRRLSAIAFVAMLLNFSAPAMAQIISNPASLVDEGTFVLDTATNKEWLKFNSTIGLSFNQAVATYSSSGWTVATGIQVQGFESLFGWTSDTPFAGVTQNNGLTDAMAGYMGYTGITAAGGRLIWATTSDGDRSGNYWNTFSGHSQDILTYHDYVTTHNILTPGDFAGAGTYGGVWMTQVAPIPEPSTYIMMLCGLGFLVFSMRRRKEALPNLAMA